MRRNRPALAGGCGWAALYLFLASSVFFILLPGAASRLGRQMQFAQDPTPAAAAPAAPTLSATPIVQPSPIPATPHRDPLPSATSSPGVTLIPSATLISSPSPLSPAPASLSAPQEQLLASVNELRSAEGCPLLQIDPLLQQAAQDHARDLAATRRIDHIGSDGATLRDRLERAGYPFQLYGENIAAGFPTAEEVVAIWTTGDEYPDGPHRKNILNCHYTEAGVGLARAADGYPYWVLDLANRTP
ncbi:MAG: hypothetical protein KatS3mg057_3237 [Herpetosiphonaceae bacterium]|nr:MAG: hypothetical protein KatS3mg057_3237 [Herpetosiphonaceae bacterium]